MARSRPPTGAIVFCAVMLTTYAILAWVAISSKSPTYDEPLHALGAWLHLHRFDFRVDPEDPPLWHYWAALPNGPRAIDPATWRESYRDVVDNVYHEWRYVVEALYATPGNDADALIQRSRAMMLIIAVVLGATMTWWSWRIGGALAMITCAIAFSLDPNFLAHGPIVKNDVTISLVMLGLAYAVWHAGRELTRWNVAAICLLLGGGLSIKFSALLFGPMLLIMLIARALLPTPWRCFGFELTTRLSKLSIAVGVLVAAALVGYLSVWAVYGLRYRPTPDPNLVLNTSNLMQFVAYSELTPQYPGQPVPAEAARAWRPGLFVRGILLAERNRLLPQAWLHGLLYTYQSSVARKSFLLGEYSVTGWWHYFPLAMLFKSPLALLGAMLASVVALIIALRLEGWQLIRQHTWLALCLLVPPGIYTLSAMGSNLNLGIRHILPVYGFIYIGIGLSAAYGWRQRQALTRYLGLALALGLAIESLLTFPHYIAFFNAAAGGPRGGFRLLSDSNLDWGQDLPLLRQWQDDHPDVKLYLCYFGTASPAAYGIEYTNLPGGYFYGPPPELPTAPGVIAISATNLQGTYLEDMERLFYRQFQNQEPLDVLGGTIYLFEYPAQ